MKKLLLVILFIGTTCHYTTAQTEVLADDYYKRGEYEKALITYRKLYDKKPYSYKYIYKLVDTYQQLEQYDEAEQLLISFLEKSKVPMLYIELGYNYQLKDSISLAKSYYKQAIEYIDEKPNYIYSIGKKFEDHSLQEEAITVYKKGIALKPDKNYNLQLARIYGDQGNVEEMFSNYLDYIAFKPNYMNNIKRAFSDFISESSTNENNTYLRKLLLKKIQQQPDTYWYELLSWLYVQERAYNKSFIQEKALYRRNPESLERIIELALTALNDNAYDTSTAIFNYIIETSQDLAMVLTSHQYLLEIRAKTATSQKELEDIDKAYQDLFTTFGTYESTIALQLAYGDFLAFYYDKPKEASTFLKKTIKLGVSPYQEAKVKLKLADILVLQEKFNEALIFYSQIQNNLKNSTISQEARFKVAKTSYFKGDFDWAESQLKILKASTSQLIANDALDLKLLISDNKYDDSTQTALKLYAKADLLAFQNKTQDAINILNKVLEEHKGESITDQALFKQAKLFEKQKEYPKAEKNYLAIISDYKEDILADDAYFYLAELYNTVINNPEEAKLLYEKIIFEHEDSIYFIEARKKYRMLRGDAIN